MSFTIPNDFDDRTWDSWTKPSFVEVDGVPTAYRRAGTGPTVLYLHGGGGTRSWTPLHQKLADKFDLVAPEHPGFGDTPRANHMDSWQDFVLHYDGLLRALELDSDPIHLVGTSLGAWVAANLSIHYPNRFESLTLITPLGTRIVNEPLIDIFRMTPQQELAAFFNGREDRYIEQLAQGDDLDAEAHSYQEQTTAALLFWNPRYDYKLDFRLPRITAPTLVLGAEEDRIVGDQQAARYAELIPNAELKIIHGPDGEPSGHGIPIEQPGEVVVAIDQHILAARPAEFTH